MVHVECGGDVGVGFVCVFRYIFIEEHKCYVQVRWGGWVYVYSSYSFVTFDKRIDCFNTCSLITSENIILLLLNFTNMILSLLYYIPPFLPPISLLRFLAPCPTSGDLVLANKTTCELAPGNYSYNTVLVSNGTISLVNGTTNIWIQASVSIIVTASGKVDGTGTSGNEGARWGGERGAEVIM